MTDSVFRYIDTRPKSCPQPVGFYRYKAAQVYKATVPPPENGTHVSIHRNLSSRYQRPDTWTHKLAYEDAFKLLYKQRPRQKVFSGQLLSTQYTAKKTNRKLASYNPLRQPAESTLFRDMLYYPHTVCNKPLYSRSEVEAIVKRLYENKKEEGRFPPIVELDSQRETYPAEILEEMMALYSSTNRLCPHPPYRNLFRDRTNAQTLVSQSAKQMKQSQIDSMVKRLNQYDDQKWPPNSTHVKTPEAKSPIKQKYPPPGSATSQRTIDVMVDRLYSKRGKAQDTETTAEENKMYEDDNSDVDDSASDNEYQYNKQQ